MTIQEYLRSTAGKRITVIGIGVSNRPLLRLLAGAGARLTARDKKTAEQLGAIVPELQSLGVELVLGEGYLDGLEGDIIFRTPGLRPDHPALLAAKARGAEITSEMEVFFAVCPCMQIAVTGSDGKTTTTTLIAEMLKAAGKTVWLGGNIGTPLLDQAEQMRPEDVAVLELSSFQLMSMEQAPHIAVITNLSPNHLDVHKDMDEYVSAKCNIFRRQGPEDVLVLNYDNELTRALAPQAPGRVRFFSRQSRLAQGVCLEGGVITDDGAPVMAACLTGETNAPLRRGCALLFAGVVLTASAMQITSTMKHPEITDVQRERAAFLQESGLTFGYATFWNANVITELTNGEVEAVGITIAQNEKGQGVPRVSEWLEAQENRRMERPDERVFMLLTEAESERLDDFLKNSGAQARCTRDGMTAYEIESQRIFFETAQAMDTP